ncbi:TRAP transporter large permease [Stella sp.]|uniref:TRAP transporter large permease n=1 Tax=Stella sp. TaxID=2912054 RepID=UPI0035AE759F
MSGWVADFALALGVLLALLLGGMWIPFAIGIAGLVSLYFADGLIGFRALGLVTWGSVNSFTLTAIPLFILMADLLLQSGVSHRFYVGLTKLVRGLPGGLLQTNIAGCAMFAAISGSSVATAAAIGTVALPQLDQRGYDRRMAAGSLCAGGTLGILIPPSIPLIIYGTFTETSIARLFMAGVVPGFLLALVFMVYVGVVARLRPSVAPPDRTQVSLADKARALVDLVPFILLMATVLGGIYFGFATPTEAGAIGASLALVVSLVWGDLTLARFRAALTNTVKISCSLLFIILTAFIFAYAVENVGVSQNIARLLVESGLDRYQFLIAVIVMYVVLGCVVDSIGMIVLTVPLLYPAVIGFGFDGIWFGVILVIMVELGQITPPFGINLFVVQGISKWSLRDVNLGCLPYWFLMLGFAALLTVVPELALWLPGQMFDR